MTVNTGAYLAQSYAQAKALGDKAVSSDSMFVVDGFEHMRLLIKQFPWPILSSAGEIEVPGPNGSKSWQPQQLETAMQGQVTIYETVKGHTQAFIDALNASGGKFSGATVYEGSMEKYSRAVKIEDGFFNFDNPDRDWENRSQVLTISGTLFFHFFGEQLPGNL
jgi:hypothetical protein